MEILKVYNFTFYLAYRLLLAVQYDKKQSAYGAALFMSLPLFLNIITISQLIEYLLHVRFSSSINHFLTPAIILLIVIFSIWFFLGKQRYIQIEIKLKEYEYKKKLKLTLFSFLYLIVSFVLFFTIK